MTLTDKQREVLQRMAAGDSLVRAKWTDHCYLEMDGDRFEPNEIRMLLVRGLVAEWKSDVSTAFYELTELGRAAAKGEV